LYICHVITTIERGGAEKAVLTLAREQVRRGYKVEIVPIKGSLDLEQEMLATGIVVNKNLLNKTLLVQIFRLQKVIGRKSIDLVHAHLPRAEILTRIALRKKTTPFFVTRHNAEPFLKRRLLGVSTLLSRWVVKRCKVVIAISKEVEAYSRINKEIPKGSTIEVVNYGYQRKYSERRNLKTRTKGTAHELSLVTVSRLVPQKNLKLAIDLIHALNNLGINANLTIVGAGPLEIELRRYAKQLDLDNSIVFFGKINNVFTALEGKDIFLMTSHYEGFGLAVLEAIDIGLPVCAPRHSAFLEVMGDSDPGFFEPNSLQSLLTKIIQLREKPKLLQNMRKRQQIRLQKFSVQNYVTAHSRIYKHESGRGE